MYRIGFFWRLTCSGGVRPYGSSSPSIGSVDMVVGFLLGLYYTRDDMQNVVEEARRVRGISVCGGKDAEQGRGIFTT